MKRPLLKILFLGILLFGCSVAYAQKQPENHYTEKEVIGNNVIQTILAYPKYYKDGNTFKEVDTSIVISSDIGWDWEVKKGVYQLRIKNDGTFEQNHLGDIVSRKILGIGFFNSDTKEKIVRTNLTLSNPTVNGNGISWSLPLGCSYKLIYGNNVLRDILIISQQAKTYLKNNKPNGWTLDNTWMGIIYDMDLSQSSMIESKDFESDGDIKFISNGRVKHLIRKGITKHKLFNKHLYADNTGKFWTRRAIYKNGKYVDAIKVVALDSVDGELIFNDTISFQEGVSSYSGCIDTYIRGGAHATTNFDASGDLWCKWPITIPGTYNRVALISFDVSDIPSDATVTSTVLSMVFSTDVGGANNTYYLYDCLRTWVENQTTFNIYSTGNNWTTAGCMSDTNDLTGTAGTATGSLTSMAVSTDDDTDESRDFPTSAGFVTSAQTAVTASGLVNWVIHGTINVNTDLSWHDSEQGTSASRPKLTIIYTPAAAGAGQVIRWNII